MGQVWCEVLTAGLCFEKNPRATVGFLPWTGRTRAVEAPRNLPDHQTPPFQLSGNSESAYGALEKYSIKSID
jgi:hypothetical protein